MCDTELDSNIFFCTPKILTMDCSKLILLFFSFTVNSSCLIRITAVTFRMVLLNKADGFKTQLTFTTV